MLLANDGETAVRFTLTPNDFGGTPHTQPVGPRQQLTVEWSTNDGHYDITITADDGTGFTHRYAGTLHPGTI